MAHDRSDRVLWDADLRPDDVIIDHRSGTGSTTRDLVAMGRLSVLEAVLTVALGVLGPPLFLWLLFMAGDLFTVPWLWLVAVAMWPIGLWITVAPFAYLRWVWRHRAALTALWDSADRARHH